MQSANSDKSAPAGLTDQEKIQSGLCPTCAAPLNFSEGCKLCMACGWSACG